MDRMGCSVGGIFGAVCSLVSLCDSNIAKIIVWQIIHLVSCRVHRAQRDDGRRSRPRAGGRRGVRRWIRHKDGSGDLRRQPLPHATGPPPERPPPRGVRDWVISKRFLHHFVWNISIANLCLLSFTVRPMYWGKVEVLFPTIVNLDTENIR